MCLIYINFGLRRRSAFRSKRASHFAPPAGLPTEDNVTHVLDYRFHGNDRMGRVYVIPDLIGNPVFFLLPPLAA